MTTDVKALLKTRRDEHRGREALDLCCRVLAYRFGVGPYNFSNHPRREIAQLEAWEEIETDLLALVGDPRR